jgi:hypothetical protein
MPCKTVTVVSGCLDGGTALSRGSPQRLQPVRSVAHQTVTAKISGSTSIAQALSAQRERQFDMSFAAVNFVLKQQMDRSSDKFLLLCLANYANDEGYSYPSQVRIQAETSLERKTVMGGLRRLVEGGYIKDTERRCGSTLQVTVWRLIGLPELSKRHYVYQVTDPNTGEFYIGKRSCDLDPLADPYTGSGAWPKKVRSAGGLLIKTIVETFATSAEATVAEQRIIREMDAHLLCRNEGGPYRQRENQHKRTQAADASVSRTVAIKKDSNSAVFPVEGCRFSDQTVPFFPSKGAKNGTRNLTEPSDEPYLEKTHVQSAKIAVERVIGKPQTSVSLFSEEIDTINEPLQEPMERAVERIPEKTKPLAASKAKVRAAPAPKKVIREATEFSMFWDAYPRKTGKLEAERKFEIARRRATFEQIMDGLARCEFDERPKFIMQPERWLHGGHWLDVQTNLSADPYGLNAWHATITSDGTLSAAMYDPDDLRPILIAAGWEPSWRGSLDILNAWMRDGYSPDSCAKVIASAIAEFGARGNLAAFDKRVRFRAERIVL